MSKQIRAEISCPDCGTTFSANLYRSLWIEDAENRALVEDDLVNLVTCPGCNKSSRLEFSLLCTNVKRKFAVWYEPYHDAAVDKDVMLYRQQFGPNSFYAKAPRVRDWGEFKKKIRELEAITDPSLTRREVPPDKINIARSSPVSIAGPSQQNRPRHLSRLKSAKNRFWYSIIPAAMLMLSVLIFISDWHFLEVEVYLGALVLTLLLALGLFIVLSTVNLVAADFKPWRERSKLFRLYWFGVGSWFAFFSLVAAILDPFRYGWVGYWEAEEAFHFFGLTILIPGLIGVLMYTYQRFVK